MKRTVLLIASIMIWLVIHNQPVLAQNSTETTVKVSIENEALDFSLPSLTGKEVKLSDYKGKKVLLHFWATWCPPCKWEMSHLQKFSKKETNIEILAINIDPKNDVRGFAEKYQLTLPILLDQTGEVNEAYSILSIPTSFLVNEEGRIVKKQIGAMTVEQMEEFIKN
jgi:peroxiredoxin